MPPTDRKAGRRSAEKARRQYRFRIQRRLYTLAGLTLIALMTAFVTMAFDNGNGNGEFVEVGEAGLNEVHVSSEPLSQEEVYAESEDLPLHLMPVEDIGVGPASFYGRDFAGRRTASGERFDPGALTAAHRTLPIGSKVRVTNLRNGRSVVVRINDRGPFHGNRVIDLSHEAARQIGMVQRGVARVQLELLARRS